MAAGGLDISDQATITALLWLLGVMATVGIVVFGLLCMAVLGDVVMQEIRIFLIVRGRRAQAWREDDAGDDAVAVHGDRDALPTIAVSSGKFGDFTGRAADV